jgi:hypothetical protein
MSDWGATHSTSILAGLDQEMPGGTFFGGPLASAVADGSVPEAAVDASCRRVLTPMFGLGLFDKGAGFTWGATPDADATSEERRQLAVDLSAATQVLVQNTGDVLPLAGGAFASTTAATTAATTTAAETAATAAVVSTTAFKIAIVGWGALTPVVAGGGSGSVFPGSNVVSPRAALLAQLGIADTWAGPGLCNAGAAGGGTRTEGWGWSQWGCESMHAADADGCEDMCGRYHLCSFWTFTPGGTGGGGGGCTFYPTDRYPRPKPGAVSGGCAQAAPPASWMCGGPNGDTCVAFADGTGAGGSDAGADAAAALAREADVAVVVLTQFGKEGTDRDSAGFAQQVKPHVDASH